MRNIKLFFFLFVFLGFNFSFIVQIGDLIQKLVIGFWSSLIITFLIYIVIKEGK